MSCWRSPVAKRSTRGCRSGRKRGSRQSVRTYGRVAKLPTAATRSRASWMLVGTALLHDSTGRRALSAEPGLMMSVVIDDREAQPHPRLLGYSRAAESIDRLESIQVSGRTGTDPLPCWSRTIFTGLTDRHMNSTATPNNGSNGPRRGVTTGRRYLAGRLRPEGDVRNRNEGWI